jgi:hypothetical protein
MRGFTQHEQGRHELGLAHYKPLMSSGVRPLQRLMKVPCSPIRFNPI